ncbi:MAG TPA: hypothetical protein VIC28_14550 [Thermoanaerobaculia bacterium]|jgi:hypothetical protein
MRRILVLILAISTALSLAAAETPNLAGKWRPDPQRSTTQKTLKPAAGDPNVEAPPAPTPEQAGHPLELIEQSGAKLKITLHDEHGEPTNTLVISPDGKETYQEMSGGALVYVSTAHWEGDSLVVEWRMERDGRLFISGKDVRTLEGADTQRLVRDIEDAKSRTHSVIVLVKEEAAAH